MATNSDAINQLLTSIKEMDKKLTRFLEVYPEKIAIVETKSEQLKESFEHYATRKDQELISLNKKNDMEYKELVVKIQSTKDEMIKLLDDMKALNQKRMWQILTPILTAIAGLFIKGF